MCGIRRFTLKALQKMAMEGRLEVVFNINYHYAEIRWCASGKHETIELIQK